MIDVRCRRLGRVLFALLLTVVCIGPISAREAPAAEDSGLKKAAAEDSGLKKAAAEDSGLKKAAAEDSLVKEPSAGRSAHEQRAFDLFKWLVETDTTHSSGDTLGVVEKIASRLREEGIPEADIQIVEFGGKGNLVARLRAQSPIRGPLLLMAHLDVVEADPADWSLDPKTLTEKEGYYYGRGVLDDKNEVAIHLTNFIRLHRENPVLQRDVIIALTSDEEGGP
ncbi:MAG: hypothetical protein ACI8Z1_001786, partial [Candidatus Azotimanducaceae bacterium]